jgi:outer membrane protein assembly factor BamE (lipoprotein component of BamABCDE complex)
MTPSVAFVGVLLLLILPACDAVKHREAVSQPTRDSLSVGKVQREIRRGMTGADVVEALGSPNVVTTDELGREVWVYDRISTETAFSEGSGYATALILGGAGRAGASSRSQRTLTIIIKFDEAKQVRDFAYRQSSF